MGRKGWKIPLVLGLLAWTALPCKQCHARASFFSGLLLSGSLRESARPQDSAYLIRRVMDTATARVKAPALTRIGSFMAARLDARRQPLGRRGLSLEAGPAPGLGRGSLEVFEEGGAIIAGSPPPAGLSLLQAAELFSRRDMLAAEPGGGMDLGIDYWVDGRTRIKVGFQSEDAPASRQEIRAVLGVALRF